VRVAFLDIFTFWGCSSEGDHGGNLLARMEKNGRGRRKQLSSGGREEAKERALEPKAVLEEGPKSMCAQSETNERMKGMAEKKDKKRATESVAICGLCGSFDKLAKLVEPRKS